ncbi:MAG: indole-3-glycerol phosphate synthase [Clostridia bacterium]|nr:indole-3-glycerol phosphate synthase [Clostridia bacterium]
MLSKILEQKIKEIREAKKRLPLSDLEKKVSNLPLTRDFTVALKRKGNGLNLIAELKKASPSKGIINADFDIEDQARKYTAAGAAAISVLTDKRFFKGSLDYLPRVRKVISCPLLRKDFIIDPYQIYEARAFGADAILLIVAALEKSQLKDFLHIAHNLGLAALVEVHTVSEIETAVNAGARIIGINNRDLKTFEVDLNTTLNLRPYIRPGIIVVSESGIKNEADANFVAEAGIDAILVGEALMRSKDIEAKVKELTLRDKVC